jgi:uncharacterized protein (TIGR02217 family)
MTFYDTRLPDHVERNARGGPMFKTTVLELSSGQEQRNIDWSLVRHYWDIGYGVQERADYEEVRTFFLNMRGKAHTFRFRDWTDYELTDELLGTGDGVVTDYNIIRTYDGELPYTRRITRPDESTIEVKLDGVVTVAYTVDAGGIISFNSAPGVGVLVTISCEFDIPMRFDTDKFELDVEWSEAAATGGLPVVEVREYVS